MHAFVAKTDEEYVERLFESERRKQEWKMQWQLVDDDEDVNNNDLDLDEEEQQRPDKRYFYGKPPATLPFKKINEALKLRPVKEKPGTAAYYRKRVMDKRDCPCAEHFAIMTECC
jgi:hypothetical protein